MLYTEEAIKKRKANVQKIKNTMTLIAYLLLLPILIYNTTLIFQAIKTPNKTPSFMGIKTYVIVSGSMEPNFNIGDIVLTKEIDTSTLQEQDIISFRQGQSVITHRIIEILEEDGKTKYRTQGDNNNTPDLELTEGNLIEGKVVGKIPVVGKISLLLKGKVTFIVMGMLIYIYYAHTSSVNRRKTRRKAKRLRYEENKEQGEN